MLKEGLGRASHLQFLVILDEIDHENQLDALLPESMLDSAHLIIITTRDQSVLRGTDFQYKMKGMNKDRAKELFCSHAFHGGDMPAAYENLVERFVEFCGGLPLSLIVLGAHVYRRDEYYWGLELEKVQKIQPKDIMQRLKISFDGLDIEEKQIFLDIACLFNKKDRHDIISNAIIIWKASGWSAEHALQTLKDKCLVEVDLGTFKMHDHLRDLGRRLADELGPPRLWRSEQLRSMEEKGLKQILTETQGRCFHSLSDSSLRRRITYFIAETGLMWLEMRGMKDSLSMSIPSLIRLPSWIPLHKLHIFSIWRVKELCCSFQQQLQINPQASFELRKLWIYNCPSLQKLPELIEMFSHLEDLDISFSLDKTDTTSLVQSIKQLGNLRSLRMWSNKCSFFSGNFDLSMDSLEIIILTALQNISKLVISGEMCPRLQTLQVFQMNNLEEMELKKLERLSTLRVTLCPQLQAISGLSTLIGLQILNLSECAGLKWLPTLSHLRHLEEIKIERCPELQSLEGAEELRISSLFIEIPDDGYASLVQNYIYGLRVLPVKKIMQIIVGQKATSNASSKLNANLFSDVIGPNEVSETDRGYKLEMSSSSSAITIYALLVSDWVNHWGSFVFEFEVSFIKFPGVYLIIVVLTQHDIEGSLNDAIIEKGFKVTMKVGEEGKAVTVLQRIADQLYP